MKRYKAIAEYYDVENAHHPMLQQDVPLLLKHIPRRRQSILELATGTGRAAIPLAQAGHRVVGVDYADDMLEIARRKRDLAGLRESQLSLVNGDILRLKLKQKFDWVILLFNTFLGFPTLAEQDQLLQMVVRHLKPNGRFWLDIFQPNLAILAKEVSENLAPHVFYVPHLQRTVFKTTGVRRDPAAQLQRITFHYKWFDARGKEHRKQVKFELTFIFPRELQLLLERNGLKIQKLYGDYDASPLNADSPRMIAMCRLKV
jgi:ubiquinone/menaquinone biosynthesis C-methylase UbiE